MSEEKKDFVVKDRRAFSEENREDETQDKETSADSSSEDETKEYSIAEEFQATEAPPADSSSEDETEENSIAEESQTTEAPPETPLPEINFATFVVSLNASALLNLGAIEDPTTGQTSKNLAMAKQTIDILCLLEEKTEGNLTTEETNLLKNILYDLRIIYVKESG